LRNDLHNSIYLQGTYLFRSALWSGRMRTAEEITMKYDIECVSVIGIGKFHFGLKSGKSNGHFS
jgi:hypothetical protein